MSEPQVVTDPNWGASPSAAHGAPAVDYAREAKGAPVGSYTSSDAPPSDLLQMLGPLAHPETLTDFARLLTLPVDTVRKALASAIAARVGPPLAGSALSATGRGLETVGNKIEKPAQIGGAMEVLRGDPRGVLALVAPTVAQAAGRGLQRLGGALTGESTAISATEEAQLLKQGYSPQVIAKMRTATPPTARPTIAAAPVATAPVDAAPPVPAAATPEPMATPPPPKVMLYGKEAAEYHRLVTKAGKTHQEALELIQAQRDFQARFGLKTPTADETRFPKGNRGGSPEGDE